MWLPLVSILLAQVGAAPGESKSRSSLVNLCDNIDANFRCNKHGYFETTQCDGEGCFCVTPHTAVPAYDTRTANPGIIPKCGACIQHIKDMLATGDLPRKTFIPKCDTAFGDFEPLQCDQTRQQCFCVDEKTGRELASSRVPFRDEQTTKCSNIEFKIKLSDFVQFEKVFRPKFIATNPLCAQAHDRGTNKNCRNSTELRYFFHPKTYQCLAFQYLGCGGNENNFKNERDCYNGCAMQDFFQCGGHQALDSNGVPFFCPKMMAPPPPPPGLHVVVPIVKPEKASAKLDSMGCPKGYQCQMGAFNGVCCNSDDEKKSQNGYNLKCANGGKVWMRESSDGRDPIKGISCSDNFCPTSMSCQQNEMFAFCCSR